MSKIRLVAILILLASLAVSARTYFSADDPLVARYELCLDLSADEALVAEACGDVLAVAWLPDETRNVVQKHRAHAYKALNKYDLALDDLSQAIVLRSDDANAFVMRAGAYLSLEDLERAEQDYQKAVAVDPEDTGRVNWWIRQMSWLDQSERVLAACEQLLIIDPDDSSGVACKVQALIKLGRYETAIEIVKQDAKSASGERARGAYFYLGRLYLHLDYGKEETLAAFEAWKATGEDHPLPSLFLGATYLKFGDEDAGIRYISEVADQMSHKLIEHPFGPWKTLKTALVQVIFRAAVKHYFTGFAYSMIRKYDRAKQEYDRFVQKGGPNAKSLLVNILSKEGYVPSAKAANADQRVFDRGLERYMVHNGRKFSLDALASKK